MRKKWITIQGVMINTDNVNTIKIIRSGNVIQLIITFIDGTKHTFETLSDEEFMKWRTQLNEK